jgi:hypothetical protein
MTIMSASPPFVSIIVGAPGCGKTTLAPYIALLTDSSRERGDHAGRTSALIDAFIDRYKDIAPAEAQRLWSTFACEHGLAHDPGRDPESHRRERVAESGDHDAYHDPEGRVRRMLTAHANALVLSRAIDMSATVLISGTGMAMHRFVPIFRRLPAADFKIIVPISGYRGYFRNTAERAVSVRTGAAGVANGRSVEAEAMMELYARQEVCTEAGGLWASVAGLRKGAELVRILGSDDSGGIEDEIREIELHLEFFSSDVGRIARQSRKTAE